MDWIVSNWGTILEIVFGIIGVATAVAKVTKNETANKWIAFIMKVVDLVAIHAKTTKFVPKEE